MLEVLAHLSARGWLVMLAFPPLAVVAVLGFGPLAIEPRYATLAVEPRRQQEVTELLDEHGVRWRLDPSGPVLSVQAHRRAQAGRLLARRGLTPSLRPRRREPGRDPASEALERRLNELIEDTVGADRAFVEASVSVSLDRVSRRSLRPGRRGVPLARRRQVERYRSETARGDRASATRYWAADRTVTDVRFAPGGVKRVGLALVVDTSVSRRQARELRRAVATAAGIDRARGDLLHLTRLRLPASRAERAPAGGWRASPEVRAMARFGPWALLAFATLLFLAEIRRALRSARSLADGDARPSYLPSGSI